MKTAIIKEETIEIDFVEEQLLLKEEATWEAHFDKTEDKLWAAADKALENAKNGKAIEGDW